MVSLKFESQSSRSGQAITEYVLMIAIIVSLAFIIRNGLKRFQVADLMLLPLQQNFYYLYRYGHVQTRGPDEGGFKHHPRYFGSGNGRLFLNPGRRN